MVRVVSRIVFRGSLLLASSQKQVMARSAETREAQSLDLEFRLSARALAEERACNAPEWEPRQRDMLETLMREFVPPFPASGRRNVATLPAAKCQTAKPRFGTMPWNFTAAESRLVESEMSASSFVRTEHASEEPGIPSSERASRR